MKLKRTKILQEKRRKQFYDIMQEEEAKQEVKAKSDQQPIDHLPSGCYDTNDDIIEVSTPSISKQKLTFITPTKSVPKKKKYVPKFSKKHPSLPGTLITDYASPATIQSPSSSLYPKEFWGFCDENKECVLTQ